MFALASTILKYLFTVIIYIFIFAIIRLIYLDIRSSSQKATVRKNAPYLKLLNQRDFLPFKVEEDYSLEGNITLGRLDKNDICIRDPYISSTHLALAERAGKYYIRDMQSKNGTYLNGQRLVAEEKQLQNGDRIYLGQLEFIYLDGAVKGDRK